MANVSLVPFWLDVKKEYVIENFEKLIEYLSACSQHPEAIGDVSDVESDFNRTFYALQSVVYEYVEELKNIKIYETLDEKQLDIIFVVRAIGAYLLSGKLVNTCDHEIFGVLVNILVASNNIKSKDTLLKMQELIYHCMNSEPVRIYGFSWSDIKEFPGLETFCYLVAHNTIFESCAAPKCELEAQGLLTLENNKLQFSPFNSLRKSDLAKRNRLAIQFDLPTLDILNASKECVAIKDFDKLKNALKDLSVEQRNFVAVPVIKKKTYDYAVDRDDILVKVVAKYPKSIVAETVDLAYEKIRGTVYVKPSLHGITYNLFMDTIQEGDYINVRLQNRTDMPFVVNESFEEFYKNEVMKSDSEMAAIYLEPYGVGKKWLTHKGLTVNIRSSEDSEDVYSAMDNKQIINIRVYERRPDNNGNYVINASYGTPFISDDYDDVTPDEFVNLAYKSLLDDFLDYCYPDIEPQEEKKIPSFDVLYVRILEHISYHISKFITNSKDRYSVLYSTLFLAETIGDTESKDYINTELRYLYALIQFAKGATPKLIEFCPEESMSHLDKVKKMEHMIKRINTYDDSEIIVPDYADYLLPDEKLYETVDGLIYSSNRLNGKINRPEINRIKRSIAKHLKVDDEYVNITSDITYYGEESDTLEFKSSIIYSPDDMNKYSPSQIWEILKAICAFMNTLTGGEILLGVKDSGYSCGVMNDLQYMYNNGMISEMSMDKYRTYIKYKADRVFTDDSDMSKGTEISTGRIAYIIEKDKEGNDILRIQVRPYEYGIVMFDKSSGRPDHISQTYIRRSGDSFPMNAELRRQAKEKKLNASYDGNLKKFILLQLAAKEGKVARIINYASHNSKKDRIVEPFHPIPEHDAFLVYDTEKNENREYKISRMEDVEVLDRKWTKTNKHKVLGIDLFGFMENQKVKAVNIELKLKSLPYNLLLEEYKDASKYLSENQDASDNNEYPYILKTKVYNMLGVGRFYMGLANEIKIVKGEPLKDYIREYIKGIADNI